ncbi:hypothetical protein BSKO_03518 [Bryopsis sp. KO-2023]|nr:hypothetical protein BSKO_03518 [Bryopsis sp. KO-2023]
MDAKKYSAAEFPTDEEINAAAAKSGPGCLGVTYGNWAKLVAALLALYCFLALLYWGLLEAAIEIRKEDWLELPNRFFGPFSKVERQLTDLNGEAVQVSVEGLDFRRNVGHIVNYPEGCEPVEPGSDLLQCGKDGNTEQKRLWSIFPWIALNKVGGCNNQTYTTLVNEPSQLSFGVDGDFAPDVCVNSAAKAVAAADTT